MGTYFIDFKGRTLEEHLNKLFFISSNWYTWELRRIVQPKMKFSLKSTHLQVILDVDKFVPSSEQIWRNKQIY